MSIGDSIKLDKFLEINPFVPRDTIFVDDYGLDAYEAAGFTTSLGLGATLPKNKPLQPPAFNGWGEWWKYLSNVVQISPAPSDKVTSQQVLAAVSKLGGTLVVDGENVIYQWKDSIPGDHPDLKDVMAVIRSSK